VNNEHSYYKGNVVAKNASLRALFNDLFNGNSVEKRLTYFDANKNFKSIVKI
jgi:hypothetical protein